MLKIEGIQKLLSVNPHLRGIEEFKDRYRLHILSDNTRLPLLFDILRVPTESNDIQLYLHSITDNVFEYNSFPMRCSLKTFSDITTFTEFFDIIIKTFHRGGLSGSRLSVSSLRPYGKRLDVWGKISM